MVSRHSTEILGFRDRKAAHVELLTTMELAKDNRLLLEAKCEIPAMYKSEPKEVEMLQFQAITSTSNNPHHWECSCAACTCKRWV